MLYLDSGSRVMGMEEFHLDDGETFLSFVFAIDQYGWWDLVFVDFQFKKSKARHLELFPR